MSLLYSKAANMGAERGTGFPPALSFLPQVGEQLRTSLTKGYRASCSPGAGQKGLLILSHKYLEFESEICGEHKNERVTDYSPSKHPD